MKQNSDIIICGIESSCDETACAIVENGRTVLSNVVSSQIEIHQRFGGVVPEIASRNHVENIDSVFHQALKQSGKTLKDISAIAVTYGAGLVGALFVGVSFAKGLSLASNIPLIATNHIEGHICANYITHKNLNPPFICLLASGGNTAIVKVTDFESYEILAQTVDDAVGEAFDKVARIFNLPYPGGVHVDKLAQQGQDTFKFHTTALKNGDFSFSGLKTAVLNTVHNAHQKNQQLNQADVLKSFTVAAIDGLVKRTAEHCKAQNLNSIAVAGGVAANSYLRQKLTELSSQGFEIFLPEMKYCGDNAAMIASRAYFQYKNNNFADLTLTANPSLRLKTK